MIPLEINKKIAEARGVKTFYNSPDGHHITNIDPVTKEITFDYVNKKWAENIADAWELFEEMPAGTSVFKCFLGKIEWLVEKQSDEFHELIYSSEMTAPLAICMAWLKWKEHEQRK